MCCWFWNLSGTLFWNLSGTLASRVKGLRGVFYLENRVKTGKRVGKGEGGRGGKGGGLWYWFCLLPVSLFSATDAFLPPPHSFSSSPPPPNFILAWPLGEIQMISCFPPPPHLVTTWWGGGGGGVENHLFNPLESVLPNLTHGCILLIWQKRQLRSHNKFWFCGRSKVASTEAVQYIHHIQYTCGAIHLRSLS